MLTCIMRYSQNHMYEQQVTLADAAADTRTASHSQHKPTHALGHSLCIGIQLCRPRAAKSVRACVTVRPVRVSAAGGAGAAGAAHTTNSVRHMLLAVFETGLQPSLLKGSEIPSTSLQDTRPGSWSRKYKCIKVFFCFTMLTLSVMPHPLQS